MRPGLQSSIHSGSVLAAPAVETTTAPLSGSLDVQASSGVRPSTRRSPLARCGRLLSLPDHRDPRQDEPRWRLLDAWSERHFERSNHGL